MTTFSVLLPTRNRLELLKYAVESVRRQDYPSWELVISDNASEEEIGGYVDSIGDKRIRCHRTSRFVPVTDNWNNALEHATGDYILTLGDDDCLMRGCLRILSDLIERYDAPDLIYTDAYLFAYPGVLDQHPRGFLRKGYDQHFQRRDPFLLEAAGALDIVRSSLRFEASVNFNMQLSVIRHSAIEALRDKGPFFQSMFPDFYATNVMFLAFHRVLVYRQPLVTIGISPKSYGFYHFSRRQKSGKAILYGPEGDQRRWKIEHVQIPGNWELDGWLSAMDTLAENFGPELKQARLSVDYARYRRLQISYLYLNRFLTGKASPGDFNEAMAAVRLWEKIVYGLPLRVLLGSLASFPEGIRGRALQGLRRIARRTERISPSSVEEGEFKDIGEVFERLEPVLPVGPVGPG